MAELIEPFERELRRSRNAPRRRTDGMSDDGLSYSVALDFDKQLGNALAEMEARTNDPRFIPGARVENPDSPELLRQELLDPVISGMNAYRGVTTAPVRSAIAKPTASPRLTKEGSNTWMEDPLTREWKLVVGGAKQPERLTQRQQSEIRVAEQELAEARRAMDKIPNDRDNVDAYGEAVRRFRKAQQKHSSLVQPVEAAEEITAQTATDLEARDPLGGSFGESFMGAGTLRDGPTGPNMIQEDFVAVVNPKGKATRIKASDLQRALKSGYKRL